MTAPAGWALLSDVPYSPEDARQMVLDDMSTQREHYLAARRTLEAIGANPDATRDMMGCWMRARLLYEQTSDQDLRGRLSELVRLISWACGDSLWNN